MSKILKQYFFTAIIILIVMLPNIILIYVGEDSIIISPLKKIVFFVFSLAYVVFPLVFFKPKIYAGLSIFLDFFLIYEIFNIIAFKAPSSDEMFATVFNTNFNESFEFATSHLVYLVLFVSLLIIQFILFIKIKIDFKIHKKMKILIAVGSIIIFSILFGRDFYFISKHRKELPLKEHFIDANWEYKYKLKKLFPISFYFKINSLITGQKKIGEYNENIKDITFNAIKKDSLQQSEIYVFVIGETARKYNFQNLGYYRETTPNLSSMKNILAFTDVKSSANLTSISVPFLVTRATPNNVSLKLKEPTILKAFEEANFKTYWLTNQPNKMHGIVGIYSRSANYYKSVAVSIDVSRFDEFLLPELDVVLKDTSSNKKFIIIHTLGSHFRYNYRYPETFEKFKPTVSKTMSITANNVSLKTEFVNSYDNSILYTDYILSEIVKRIDKTNSISYMYFISDHGENLYDDDREYLMHGLTKPTKYETDVPLFIWNSDKYKAVYPEKIENLENHINSKISSSNTFCTLLDMANIKYRNQKLQKSFASEKFDSLQSRYLFSTNKKVIKLD